MPYHALLSVLLVGTSGKHDLLIIPVSRQKLVLVRCFSLHNIMVM